MVYTIQGSTTPTPSHHNEPRVRTAGVYGEEFQDNLIIFGEGVATLTALERNLSSRVKAVYIDPPYNNGERYTHFSDVAQHDHWLSNMTAHISAIRNLISDDGSIWVSIDDTEMHYLKIAMDGIFGRANFVSTIVWEHRTTRENRASFSHNNEFILVYAKNASKFKQSRNFLPVGSEVAQRYSNPDDDPRGDWQSVSANVQGGHGTKSQFYKLVSPNGREHTPPPGRCWVYTLEKMQAEIHKNNIWFGREGNGVPRIKKFLSGRKTGLTPHTLWRSDEVGTTTSAKKHIIRLLPGCEVFDTPKPEALVKRILEIATNPGDIVLDSFLGSGTTAAVAHKMGRRYIGIDSGPHILTHSIPRLQKVVDGENGGISSEVGWKGGGGFKYYSELPGGKISQFDNLLQMPQ